MSDGIGQENRPANREQISNDELERRIQVMQNQLEAAQTKTDLIAAMEEEITRLRAQLAETQKREQDLLSERKGEGVRTRRAIAEAKKKWLAEVEGREPLLYTSELELDYFEGGSIVASPYKVGANDIPLYTYPAPAKVPDKLTNAIEHYKWCMENEVCSSIRYESKITYDTLCYVEAMLKSQGGE